MSLLCQIWVLTEHGYRDVILPLEEALYVRKHLIEGESDD
jgi:hypothetical protein